MKLPAKFAAMFAAALLLASCGDDGGNGPSTGSSEAGSSCSATRSSSAVMPDSAAKCGSDSTFVDARDDRRYRCVTIGTQTWMAENLDYEYEIDGSSYGNWCYNDSAENCARYGRLYTWAAAMDTLATGCGKGHLCGLSGKVRGICPEGWHLPSWFEWSDLFDKVDEFVSRLKSKEGWTNGNGTDDFGFSVLPSGARWDNGFADIGEEASFWTTKEYDDRYAYRKDVNLGDGEYGYISKSAAIAVRCVKD